MIISEGTKVSVTIGIVILFVGGIWATAYRQGQLNKTVEDTYKKVEQLDGRVSAIEKSVASIEGFLRKESLTRSN